MDPERRRLLREALQRAQGTTSRHYRPEKHYMRGPGPKTLMKLGQMLRAETDDVTREAIPDHWLELIQSIESGKRRRS